MESLKLTELTKVIVEKRCEECDGGLVEFDGVGDVLQFGYSYRHKCNNQICASVVSLPTKFPKVRWVKDKNNLTEEELHSINDVTLLEDGDTRNGYNIS